MTKAMTAFRQAQRHTLAMKFDSMTEQKILDFWRTYAPRKVEHLLFRGILRQTLAQTADALLDMQIRLEQSELLPPALARSEAWRRLMRIEEDDAEEAAAWGMTNRKSYLSTRRLSHESSDSSAFYFVQNILTKGITHDRIRHR